MKAAKDKAIELVEKFEEHSFMDIDLRISSYCSAVQCAKIAVEEIINTLGTPCSQCQSEQAVILEYWQEVLTCLNKM